MVFPNSKHPKSPPLYDGVDSVTMGDLQNVEDLINSSQELIGIDPLGSTFARGEPEETLAETLLENCRIAVGKETGLVLHAGGNMTIDGATVAYTDITDYWNKLKVYYLTSRESKLFTERPFIMAQCYYDTTLVNSVSNTVPLEAVFSTYCTTSYTKFSPAFASYTENIAYSFSWLAIQPYGDLRVADSADDGFADDGIVSYT